jgi:hypothetical protein
MRYSFVISNTCVSSSIFPFLFCSVLFSLSYSLLYSLYVLDYVSSKWKKRDMKSSFFPSISYYKGGIWSPSSPLTCINAHMFFFNKRQISSDKKSNQVIWLYSHSKLDYIVKKCLTKCVTHGWTGSIFQRKTMGWAGSKVYNLWLDFVA